MSDCTAAKSMYFDFNVYHLARRMIRQARTLTIIATAMLLVASILRWEPPEPKSCDPKSPQGFVLTQPASPDTIMPGCPPGLKYTIR